MRTEKQCGVPPGAVTLQSQPTTITERLCESLCNVYHVPKNPERNQGHSNVLQVAPAKSTTWSIENLFLRQSLTITRTKVCPRFGSGVTSPVDPSHSPQLTDLVRANARTLSASTSDSIRIAVCSKLRPGVPATATRAELRLVPGAGALLPSWLQEGSTASRSTTCCKAQSYTATPTECAAYKCSVFISQQMIGPRDRTEGSLGHSRSPSMIERAVLDLAHC